MEVVPFDAPLDTESKLLLSSKFASTATFPAFISGLISFSLLPIKALF